MREAAELKRAREVTGQSARQAEADLEQQRGRLEYERNVIMPALSELRERNHVADAIVELIKRQV